MVALSVIMMDELSDGTAQRLLTEEDHPLQALALDRQNKPFDISVQIRRTVQQPNDVRSGVLEQIAKLRGELLVAVHDEESLAAQKAVEWVGEIPTDLVVSKNTNELKTGSPERFGLEVSRLGSLMEARILGYEDAAPTLDLVGRRHRWLAPAMATTNKSLSFVFLDTTGPTNGSSLPWRPARVPRNPRAVLPPSSVATPRLNASVSWPVCVGARQISMSACTRRHP